MNSAVSPLVLEKSGQKNFFRSRTGGREGCGYVRKCFT
jgi:hypothetical protein